MKHIKFLIFLFALLFIGFSCTQDPEVVQYKEGGIIKLADPFIQISTPVIAFQDGIPEYKMALNLINGNDLKVSKINVYSVYTDAKSGKKSNEALLITLDGGTANKIEILKNIKYADLKKGLTVNGAALPDDEKLLAVGSGWKLRFEGETPTGKLDLPGNINLGVLSRFAGNYKVTFSDYYRIGVQTATWTGETRFIGSVSDTRFSYNDKWGQFDWPGKSFHFDIDFTTNKITVPITPNGIFSGTRPIGCATDANLFVEYPCADYNVLVRDEAKGKHVIKIAYGYFTNGSGPRAFYEILEKI